MPPRVTPDIDSAAGLDALFAQVADEPAVALAVSGGSDSLALMLLGPALGCRRKGAPRLHVYSVDHGLRPKRPPRWRWCCGRRRVWAYLRAALPGRVTSPKPVCRKAARAARYRLMGSAMADDGATVLLTAHHLQDQAETVLMRMAHGSGIEGLKGMSAIALVEGYSGAPPSAGCRSGGVALGGRCSGHRAGPGPIQLRSPITSACAGASCCRNWPPWVSTREHCPCLPIAWLRPMPPSPRWPMDVSQKSCGSMVSGRRGSSSRRLSGSVRPSRRGCLAGCSTLSAGGRSRGRWGRWSGCVRPLPKQGLAKATTVLGCVIRIKDGAIAVAREPGRALPPDAMLVPHGELVWDERFRIVNASPEAGLTASVADYCRATGSRNFSASRSRPPQKPSARSHRARRQRRRALAGRVEL